MPKSIRNIEGYSPTRGKMFFTDINGKKPRPREGMLWRHFPGNLVSSSNGFKVVGITGAVVTDIEDLVVATVIPGLGKDMATVQVKRTQKLNSYSVSIQVDAYSVDFEGVFFGENRLLSWNECCTPGAN